MTFTVAIVGRPNVGKSTLFNRLTGKRQALVDDTPGVTRDRREADASIADLHFKLFDTAGLEVAETGSLQARMTAMTEIAIAESDVVVMLIDGRAGVMPDDEYFARVIRKTRKPVVLAVNKLENSKTRDSLLADAYRLGLGDPIAVSAEHGEGMDGLYEALKQFGPEQEELEEDAPWEEEEVETEGYDPAALASAPMQITIVGRPNVGKSTLMNQILGEERTLTGPEAGITRDAISVDFEFQGRQVKLVDTAGMRRKANVTEKIEKLAAANSRDSIAFAHVVIWMIDAQAPLEKQDNTIASLVEQEGRAIVLAVNKWDEVGDKAAFMKAINQRLEWVFRQAKGIAVVPISAKTGYNVDKLLKECFKAYEVWNRHMGTGELNRWLEAAVEAHTPPLVNGRRCKIRYMTQKCARPPTFLLFCNISAVPESYIRYLTNTMRERFDLPGVPIRVKIKTGKNPYADKKS